MNERISLTSAASVELSLSDILAVLNRRKWIIFGTLLFCLAVGVLLSFIPRKYVAEGTLRVQPGASGVYRSSPLGDLSGEADKTASEVTILQSRTLFLKVAKDLNLENDAGFWDVKQLRHQTLDDPATREKMVRLMRAKIQIAHKPKDEIINLSASTLSPALSAKIVNTLINDYIEYLFQVRYGSSTRASTWLIHQLDDLKHQVEQDQASLNELQAKLGIIGFDDKDNSILINESLNSLTKAASEATVERIVSEAKYRFLGDSDPNLIEGEIGLLSGAKGGEVNSLLQNLRTSQATQSSAYARLLQEYGPNYPDVKELKSQLDETTAQVKAEQTRILNQSHLSFSAATANEQLTEKALQDKKNQAFSMRGEMGKYVILLHDYQSHRTLYETLISRLREAGITSGIEGGEIDVVDLADLPTIPAPPGPPVFLAGSILTGLFLGVIFAFFAEALNTRVTTPEQARRSTPFPLLAELPHFRWTGKGRSEAANPIFSHAFPESPYSESVESLRTSILLSTPGKEPQVMLITSSFMAEGKSTISINLASVLARHNARVLLVDCDLRRSVLAGKLHLKQDIGLSDVLAGRSTLDAALQQVPTVGNLQVLAGGIRPAGVTALMDSDQMRNLITLCRERFEYIILDCPPTLGISDVPNLGHLVEAVVFVIRNKVATRKAVKRAGEIFMAARLPVVGYVLNDVEPKTQAYGSNYGTMYGAYFKDSEGN